MSKTLQELIRITPQRLDDYLAEGWFRRGQNIFTTRYLRNNGRFHEAIWLRHRLCALSFPRWFRKMRRRGRFRLEFMTGLSSPAHELLFQKYRESRPEGWSDSLEAILYGKQSRNIFNTQILNVYDGQRLVAAGFFDAGDRSAAGICNFYDPEYARFSLGTFVYLCELEYCADNGKQYFYPGFIAPGLPGYDHKTRVLPESLESYDPVTRSWDDFSPALPGQTAVDRMERALCVLLPRLQNLGVVAQFMVNAGYTLKSATRFDLPYAICIGPPEGRREQYAITYDPDTNEYYIFDCTDTDVMDGLKPIGQQTYCTKAMGLHTPLFILMSPGLAAETMADVVEYLADGRS